MMERVAAPRPAQRALLVLVDRRAVMDPWCQARLCGPLVPDAGLGEHIGGVLVEMVVFELAVAALGVARVRGGVGAEAPGADEVVAGVGGVTAGETGDFADFGFGEGEEGGGGGEEGEDEDEAGKHCGFFGGGRVEDLCVCGV